MGEQPERDKRRRVGVAEVLLGDRDEGASHRRAVAGDLEAVGIGLMLHFARHTVGNRREQKREQGDGQEQGRRRGIVRKAVNVPAAAKAKKEALRELLGQRQNGEQAQNSQKKAPIKMLQNVVAHLMADNR